MIVTQQQRNVNVASLPAMTGNLGPRSTEIPEQVGNDEIIEIEDITAK